MKGILDKDNTMIACMSFNVKEIPKSKSPRGALQKSQAINRTAFDKYISLTIKYTQFLLAEANARLENG